MSEIRTHEQVVGIVCTLAMEAHNDSEHEREEYGTRTRQAMRRLEATDAALRSEIARLTRERDEARERAASLSRELLTAIQARDSYRASAELRVGMRREVEELLGCGDTMGEEAFERGLARLRGLVAAEKELAEFSEILSRHNHEWSERCELAESRAERLDAALREIDARTGHFGEAPPPPEWMPMLSLIAWVGRIARAALGEVGK